MEASSTTEEVLFYIRLLLAEVVGYKLGNRLGWSGQCFPPFAVQLDLTVPVDESPCPMKAFRKQPTSLEEWSFYLFQPRLK